MDNDIGVRSKKKKNVGGSPKNYLFFCILVTLLNNCFLKPKSFVYLKPCSVLGMKDAKSSEKTKLIYMDWNVFEDSAM